VFRNPVKIYVAVICKCKTKTSVCVVCVCVCVSACLSAHEHVSQTTHTLRDIYQIFVHVAYGRGSVLLQQDDEILSGRSNFGGFLPNFDSAFCCIGLVFGTGPVQKTAKQVEIPFGMMTLVGTKYHVLDGGPDPQDEGAMFEGKQWPI